MDPSTIQGLDARAATIVKDLEAWASKADLLDIEKMEASIRLDPNYPGPAGAALTLLRSVKEARVGAPPQTGPTMQELQAAEVRSSAWRQREVKRADLLKQHGRADQKLKLAHRLALEKGILALDAADRAAGFRVASRPFTGEED